MIDLFGTARASGQKDSPHHGYSAKDIEVLEGLEPVRRRPGMYIGGTDQRALHHLVAELLDNAMDEAVAGHATWIELCLETDGALLVRDNGRGIPIDPHPKFPDISALEVIMTTLHSGAKFSGQAYRTAGGLHGVGLSVVNALADRLEVEVARDRRLFRQSYRCGRATTPLEEVGPIHNRRGTAIRFQPDAEIFDTGVRFSPALLFGMVRSKAYLFGGVKIRWSCAPDQLTGTADVPERTELHFPNGLADFLTERLGHKACLTAAPFVGRAELSGGQGRVEWAVGWPDSEEPGFLSSYCNTVPTPQGGTHETGLRTGILRGLKAHGERTGNKKAAAIMAEDILGTAAALISVFLPDPQFQGQTKEKLTSAEASKWVEGGLRDHFEHWLAADPAAARDLLDRTVERAEERQRRRQSRDLARKSATRRLRLPGKLADCSRTGPAGTELFLVEGDSAGGSAKSARSRETQAILPLRGKILNVASATADKLAGNQEIANIIQALGCGRRADFDEARLRYERVIIMTDADVDGAHIAALLMTFFFREMPGLIETGHLFLAQPPLYRLQAGGTSAYARDDAHREELMRTLFKGKRSIDVSRFKGLGEMPAAQLKQTTMDPAKRTLWRVEMGEQRSEVSGLVTRLMGRKPEARLAFIQENAPQAGPLDI